MAITHQQCLLLEEGIMKGETRLRSSFNQGGHLLSQLSPSLLFLTQQAPRFGPAQVYRPE